MALRHGNRSQRLAPTCWRRKGEEFLRSGGRMQANLLAPSRASLLTASHEDLLRGMVPWKSLGRCCVVPKVPTRPGECNIGKLHTTSRVSTWGLSKAGRLYPPKRLSMSRAPCKTWTIHAVAPCLIEDQPVLEFLHRPAAKAAGCRFAETAQDAHSRHLSQGLKAAHQLIEKIARLSPALPVLRSNQAVH